MITIRVPATSANIGAGFDCMGLAVGIHNETSAEFTDREGVYVDTDPDLPKGAKNLVASSMLHTLKIIGYGFRGIHIVQTNGIPKTSGLGSSAACVVSGVLLADALTGKTLTRARMIDICNGLDGHPDNILPCITGGLTAGVVKDGHVECLRAEPRGLKVLVLVPDFRLSTALSRKALPPEYSRSDAVYNISRAALTFGALLSGEYSLLKTAVDDKIHQPYRRKLIENYDEITEAARGAGALAVWLSGAGPSIAAFIDGSFDESALAAAIAPYPKWRYNICEIDTDGATLTE